MLLQAESKLNWPTQTTRHTHTRWPHTPSQNWHTQGSNIFTANISNSNFSCNGRTFASLFFPSGFWLGQS